jgi:hypothetical protein
VAAVGIGVIIALTAKGLREDAEAIADQTRARELLDSADQRVLIGWLVAGAGLGVVAGGVVKLAMTPSVEPVSGGAVVGMRGRW